MTVIMRFGRDGFHLFRGIPLETRIRAAVRRCIAEEIEHLVNVLDMLDGDPDLENSGDDEPSLGLPNPMGERLDVDIAARGFCAGPPDDDRELDEAEGRLEDAGDEAEPDVNYGLMQPGDTG